MYDTDLCSLLGWELRWRLGGGRKERKEGEWGSPSKDSDLWGEVKFRDDQNAFGHLQHENNFHFVGDKMECPVWTFPYIFFL